jgi:hypothetical protein
MKKTANEHKNVAKEATIASMMNTLKEAVSGLALVAKLDGASEAVAKAKKEAKDAVARSTKTLVMEAKALKLSRNALSKYLEEVKPAFIDAYGEIGALKVKNGKTSIANAAWSNKKAYLLAKVFPVKAEKVQGGKGDGSALSEEEKTNTGNPVEGFETVFAKLWERYVGKIDKATALSIVNKVMSK